MINTAVHSTNGVKIPNGRQTQQVIINTFKEQLTALQAQLTVCYILVNNPHNSLTDDLQGVVVKGKVSLTCDAWQALNVNGYFAVTGSWIESTDGKWELQMALLGFIQLNSAHNGIRLGQALFKVVLWAGIAHKVRDRIIPK